jgi:hypothetical protein
MSSTLGARSRAIGEANDRKVLQVLVSAGPAGVRAGRDLADLADLRPRTTTAAVARLVEQRLAKRHGNKRVFATPAGRSQVGAGLPGLSLAPALETAIACFPAEAMRAFVRLLLSAVVARWHLADEYDSGWPSFISLGDTKTGKTAIARFVGAVLGLDRLRAIVDAQRETRGSLIGRRVQDGAGWRVERSPILDLPFVCIDEWDKGPQALQAAAGGLLMGDTVDELEGARYELRPTVYVTFNPSEKGIADLHAAWVRRSVVLDTTPLLPLLDDLDDHMWRLLRSGEIAIPQLQLEQLRPPASSLPDELWQMLRAELRAGLTEDGLRHSDVEPLALIALGRAALADASLEQAVLATAYDYLVVASTVGQARDDYHERLMDRLSAGALAPDPAAAQRQRQRLQKRRIASELERMAAREELVEQRARFDQMLEEMVVRLDLRRLKDCPPPQRVEARVLAELLRIVQNSAARSPEALQAAEERARDPYRRAGELLAQIEHDRSRRRQADAQAALIQRSRSPQRAPARHMAANIRAQLHTASGSELDSLTQQAQQLEIAPPMSEAEQRRRINELSLSEVRHAQLLNGHLLDPPSRPVAPPPPRPPSRGRPPPYAAERTARQRFFGVD